VNAERPSAVGASKPEPHPEAQRLGGIRRKLDDEAPHGGVWDDRTVRFLVGEVDVLVGRLEQAEKALRYIADFQAETESDAECSFLMQAQAREALGVPPPGGPDS
jgi:hypothetical protein